MKNALDYAIKDGLAQGMAQGRVQGVAQGKVDLILQMQKNGLDWVAITNATGITPQAFDEMRASLQ